jgi:sulfite oxidase
MRTLLKEVNGIDWFNQAVMNCRWSGPRLSTILQRAGITENMKDKKGGWKGYVAFACYETLCQDDTWYGAGVPLSRVMDEEADIILALEMNGEPLTAAHGAPVRALVPGIAGARSVKWLNRITVQTVDSPNYYQTHDYKVLPYAAVDVEAAEDWWGLVPPMMDMPVNSVVGLPKSGSTFCLDADGRVEARGFAVPGGTDGPVKTVEVSGDGGNTWVKAELDFGEHDVRTEQGRKNVKWSWCLWKARVPVARGDCRKIVCRAVDYGGNEQTEHGIWNLRGVGYNAWGLAQDLKVHEIEVVDGNQILHSAS